MSGSRSSARYFEEVAAEWDTLRKGYFRDEVREKALDLAAVRPGERAADIGAGTGFLTEALLARGLEVIAVDRSAAMLAQLEKKFGGRAGFRCLAGETEALPIESGTLDCAFANMVLHHVESPEEMIRELRRILKPGGRAVLTDFERHNFDFFLTEYYDRWPGFSPAEVASLFRAAGFAEVETGPLGETCQAESSAGVRGVVPIFFVRARR
ncbi:Ubiquinone/menaquinone biosynthesis C-methyltransferase UbiE [Methylacidimicrobium sp. AP8]|uniref:class I SAM-dependent methyltransferase n=1 Tax=Methylacidimicrobium sp. AP8 TaxID=2730359 RepID=UPI0018BF9492|nr:class I SAM-dependent methyltransferase [Methylacidimicrobium sp. AP8]CAB4243229.1 Ubiquinone/menaquinone biosynthesis C-methyltransferase UbiE [Methylacidimicrobium sp. AP8]